MYHEVIVKDLSFEKVLEELVNSSNWEKYYENCGDIHIYNQDNTVLKDKTHFRFKTFEFDVEAEVEEYILDESETCLAWLE